MSTRLEHVGLWVRDLVRDPEGNRVEIPAE